MSDRPLEFCRQCRDESDKNDEPAAFIIWGKLFRPEALGPKCYAHASDHLGFAAMHHIEQYAVFDLRNVERKR